VTADAVAAYRHALRDHLANATSPDAAELEGPGGVAATRDAMASLGDARLLEPCVLQGEGPGLPIDLDRFTVFVEELAAARPSGFALTACLHVGVYLPLLVRLGSAEYIDDLVSAALAGRRLGTIAVTEDGGGSDFLSMETTAVFDGDEVRVDGEKRFVTNATGADDAVVFARWRDGRHFANFTAIRIETAAGGVAVKATPVGAMRGAGVGTITLAGAVVQSDAVLGRRPLGFQYFVEHMAVERLVAGVWAVSASARALHATRSYALRRVVGVAPLWERDSVRQRVGAAFAETMALDALVARLRSGARIGGGGGDGFLDATMAAAVKAKSASLLHDVAALCLHLHGAGGFELDQPWLDLLADAQSFAVAGGVTEVMLDAVADGWMAPTCEVPG
jgi:alkylation response protein AidB-like acyl-CoA dehydrogenase